MKPPAPLQAHNTRTNSIFPTQRRWRFHLMLSLREQRRQQFHPDNALPRRGKRTG